MSKLTHEEKQAAMAAINAMAKANGGRITADQLVEAAADENSPLHGYFEWDDSVAAHQYRIVQARLLIGSVRYEVTSNETKLNCKGYVRDPAADPMEQGYIHVSRLRNDDDAARDVLLREFSRIAAMLTRARKIAAVLGMADPLDRMIDDLGIMTRTISETGQNLPA